MNPTNRYIEFRVYLKDNATNREEIEEAASELQDEISDLVSDSSAPDIFTEDVSYIIVDRLRDKNEKENETDCT